MRSLKDRRTQESFRENIREKMDTRRGEFVEEGTNWKTIAEILTESAEEVCWKRTRQVANPWKVGHEEELSVLNLEICAWVEERNEMAGRTREGRRRWQERLNRASEQLKEARRNMRIRLKKLEREWWEEVIRECKEASNRGNLGEMYRALRRLRNRDSKSREGTNITTEEFAEHFKEVSKDRYERTPGQIEEAIGVARDLRGTQEAREWNEELNRTPEDEEIDREMLAVKDSAPGRDRVRMDYINLATQEMKTEVRKMVKYMFEKRPHKWEQELKVGQIVPLFKKGDRNTKDNYRGVCLLAMGRVLASRLRRWSEAMSLTDENQCGFRPGRSTADATQIMVRMEEEKKERGRGGKR